MILNHLSIAKLVTAYFDAVRNKEGADEYYQEIYSRLDAMFLLAEKFEANGKTYALDLDSEAVYETCRSNPTAEEIDLFCQRAGLFIPQLAFQPSPELDRAFGYPIEQLDRLTIRAT